MLEAFWLGEKRLYKFVTDGKQATVSWHLEACINTLRPAMGIEWLSVSTLSHDASVKQALAFRPSLAEMSSMYVPLQTYCNTSICRNFLESQNTNKIKQALPKWLTLLNKDFIIFAVHAQKSLKQRPFQRLLGYFEFNLWVMQYSIIY